MWNQIHKNLYLTFLFTHTCHSEVYTSEVCHLIGKGKSVFLRFDALGKPDWCWGYFVQRKQFSLGHQLPEFCRHHMFCYRTYNALQQLDIVPAVDYVYMHLYLFPVTGLKSWKRNINFPLHMLSYKWNLCLKKGATAEAVRDAPGHTTNFGSYSLMDLHT